MSHLPDRSGGVLISSAVFLGIATLFVGLRCISKFAIRRRADTDDWITILAWCFTVALCVAVMVAACVGLGKPDDLIKPQWRGPLKKSIYVFPIFYHLSSMTAKSAALLLYIRMASAHQFLRYASYAVLIIVNITGVILALLNTFQCRPLAAAWNPNKEGKCFDTVTLFLASAPVNILSDLAILILPLPIITSLRIERNAKIGLVLTFICAGFVAVVDVVRIAYLQTALKEQLGRGQDHVNANSRPENYYWYTSYGVMWSAIECSVRVACASALVLKPLLQKLRLSASIRSRSGTQHQSRNGEHSRGASGGAILDQHHNNDSFDSGGAVHAPPPKSPRPGNNMTLQAILETDDDVPEEDRVDFMSLFAGGPPDSSPTNSPRTSPRHEFSETFKETLGMMGAPMASIGGPMGHGAPIGHGAPLGKTPTAHSHLGGHRLSMLAAPIRWITNESQPLDQTQQPAGNFFDFVQMGGRKPLTELSNEEAWWPVLFVSILFFLWGFSYGLLGTLSGKIMAVIPNTSNAKNLALQSSYWLGYILGPATIGAYTLPRHGFKATFMTGLVIYACGTMCFWPSSVLASYGGFVFSNLLIACGLSVLEVAANPFIALAGPGHLSEARLNFAQGIQAIGGIFSPILAVKVLFNNVEGRTSLFDVQWCYLAVALFVLFLALVFFYVPLSEASDDDLEKDTLQRLTNAGITQYDRAYGMPARWFVIGAGVFAMMCYVGQQEALSYYWGAYDAVVRAGSGSDPLWDLTIGHGLFAAGRFMASGACYIGVLPRLLLNVCLLGTFLTTLLAVVLPPGTGAFVCVLLAMFFEAPVFPTIFAMAIRNQGRRTKSSSIALTVAIGLAVVWTSATYGIVQRTHSVRKAFILIAVLCGVQALYPMALDGNRVLRRWVDPCWSRPIRRMSEDTMGSTEKTQHVERPPNGRGHGNGNGDASAGTMATNGVANGHSKFGDVERGYPERQPQRPQDGPPPQRQPHPSENELGIGVVGDLEMI